MKIVITSSAQTLAEPIDMHFGRAKFFILADTETGHATAHDNAQNFHAAQGAGVQSAETIARLGAEAVITGSVGPKAFRALQAAGIKIALVEAACPGTEALRRFKDGELPVLDQPNGESHWV
ncbi:MAG: dinitrogenase iron-molybdenum cofactor biosynthesis protein [Lentisphaerae bacterium]|nr:dinitrogenase iron-molybdenum cofactor biosynthesis protein [Lentisphaerota bacterium]